MVDFGGDDGTLAYDLRQRYAKIVGDHLDEIAWYRKANDYYKYFLSLEDLYTITQHKFKPPEKPKKKEEKKTKPITYGTLRGNIIRISNEYPNAWKGQGSDGTEIAKIQEGLRAMERYLYHEMDRANMFGSKRETEGLI